MLRDRPSSRKSKRHANRSMTVCVMQVTFYRKIRNGLSSISFATTPPNQRSGRFLFSFSKMIFRWCYITVVFTKAKTNFKTDVNQNNLQRKFPFLFYAKLEVPRPTCPGRDSIPGLRVRRRALKKRVIRIAC